MSDFNPMNALAGLPVGLQGLNAPGGQPPQGHPPMNFNLLQQLAGLGGHGNPRFAGHSGTPMVTPGGGGGTGPIPGTPNTQLPLNPGQMPQMPQAPMPAYGGIGSQLGVIGANPAGSPFGLPSY